MNDPEYIEAAEKAGISTLYLDSEETTTLLNDQFIFCTDEVAKLWE